jgi:predicted DNA-binding transcriptional regulator AlpA
MGLRARTPHALTCARMPNPPRPAAPSQQPEQQFISLQQASERSGISAPTLTRMARAGEVPAQAPGPGQRGWLVAWPLPEELVARVARHSRSRLRREDRAMETPERERFLWHALERRDANVATALQIADRLSRVLEAART